MSFVAQGWAVPRVLFLLASPSAPRFLGRHTYNIGISARQRIQPSGCVGRAPAAGLAVVDHTRMVVTTAADGGLGAVLTESRIARPLEETIVNVVGRSTLEDFPGWVTEKGWELELQFIFIDKCTDTTSKSNPFQLARLRQAYKIGIAARQRSTAVASESEADTEKPLEATDTLELRKF